MQVDGSHAVAYIEALHIKKQHKLTYFHVNDKPVVLEDAHEIGSIEIRGLHSCDCGNAYLDFRFVSPMPRITKFITNIAIRGFDHILDNSRLLHNVRVKLFCKRDEWFIYPPNVDIVDLRIECDSGGLFDMTHLQENLNRFRMGSPDYDISYIKTGIKDYSCMLYARVIENSSQYLIDSTNSHIYIGGEVEPLDLHIASQYSEQYASQDAFYEAHDKTIWEYLDVKPYGYSTAKSVNSAN